MKIKFHFPVTISLFLLILLSTCIYCSGCALLSESNSKTLKAGNLQCEYKSNPLGIDTLQPHLTWTLKSDVRGQKQTSYQVLVSANLEDLKKNKGTQWNTGKVPSKETVNIAYNGKPLKSSTRYYWKVRAWDKDGNPGSWSEPAWFETALLNKSDWNAKWINDGKENPVTDEDFYKFDPAPLFRKDFSIDKQVKQARLYITGLGYYEAALNGERIGDHMLDPGWTNYSKRIYYSTYDVTGQLQNGDNCLGVMVGNGWYNPLPLRMWGHKNIREFLTIGRPRFIAKLDVTYTDGSTRTVTTDESWKVAQGPILKNSIFLGEVYDARKEITGWNKPGFDDSAWSKAAQSTEPVGKLVAQPLDPIRITKKLKPVKITEPKEGVYIIDMGQNFAGLVSFRFNLEKGSRVDMRYGELLYEDGNLNPMTAVCGQIKRERNNDLQAHPGTAWQEDIYFAKGSGPETYTPRFTFHAFRYIELTGLPSKPTPDMITGLRMNTDVKRTGTFSCSNELFNTIQEICDWTFKSNIFSVQSDCPHRERFGYGGDLINTNETFMLNYDTANFYAKAVADWDDAKLENGMLTDTAPSVGIQYCGVGWAMAHPHTQVKLYQYYGDKRDIEQQYRTAKNWLALVREQYPNHIVKRGLSDHESLTKKPAEMMVTPLYYKSAKLLKEMADILGYENDAKEYSELAKEIKKAYNDNFFDPETGKCEPGTQSSQSFALYTGILDEKDRPAALKYLLEDIKEQNDHLTTGIFGTRYMLEILSETGHSQTAYNIVNQRTYPSWGNMIDNGATTLWEHWKFSDNTFSHNHPMFGSVSQWFFNWLGGIAAAPDAVGFDKILIRPQTATELEWVKSSYDSVRGEITSNWRKTVDSIVMDINIPVNTEAKVYLPCNDPAKIKESGITAAKAAGIDFIRSENGKSVFKVKSGKYKFTMPLK